MSQINAIRETITKNSRNEKLHLNYLIPNIDSNYTTIIQYDQLEYR